MRCMPALLITGLMLLATPAFAESEKEQEASKTYTNTIKWSTASEVDNFGFDVYRADSEEGPFTCLTQEPVEGGGTIDEPQRYEYVDSTIDPEKAYYYYVESISMSGLRERFTPVIRAKPKLPAAEPATPSDGES